MHTFSPDSTSLKTHRITTPRQRMLFHGAGKGHSSDPLDQNVVLQKGDVLVRITLATICGSDLHTYSGRRSSYLPSVLGHEAVGVVEAVGNGADKSLIGKRVTWTLTDTCGCCKPCTDWSIPQKCESLFKYGHAPLESGSGLNGCFASHIMLRKGTHIVELPDALPDSFVAPANCALATMVAVIEPIPATTKKVLIQGAGLLGVYGTALLKHRGVEEIWVTDIVQDRLDLVAEFGAKIIHSKDLGSLDQKNFDVVIEVAGVSQVIADGVKLLRPGGIYIWAGMVHDQTPLDILGVDIVKGCITVIGMHNYAAKHLNQSVSFLTETAEMFPWGKLISEPMPLSELDAAFALTLERKWHRVSVQADAS